MYFVNQLGLYSLRDQFVRTEERSFNSQQKWMAVRVRHRALQATDVSSSCFVHSFPSACVFCILLPFCYPPTSSALSSLLTTLLPFLTTLLPFSPLSSPSHHSPPLLTTLLSFSPLSFPSSPLSSTHPVSTLVSPSLEPIISTSSSSHLCVSSV